MANGAEKRPSLPLRRGKIVYRAMVSRNMLLLRVGDEAFRHQEWKTGSHIGLFWSETGKEHRHYTLWNYDADVGTFDLLILLHDEQPGPGLRWAREAQIGDEVLFRGPRNTYTIDVDAPYYLFAAEETGAVAIQGFIPHLPPHMKVIGALETDTSNEEFYPLHGSLPIPWVHRKGQPISSNGPLIEAIRKLDLPEIPGKAYFAGEAEQCKALRTYLIEERNWSREHIHVQPFWKQGEAHND